MCKPAYSCTLNEGKSFEAAFVIAHEMGHRYDIPLNSNSREQLACLFSSVWASFMMGEVTTAIPKSISCQRRLVQEKSTGLPVAISIWKTFWGKFCNIPNYSDLCSEHSCRCQKRQWKMFRKRSSCDT